MTSILTFPTTHHALHAEEIANGLRLGAQVIPAPAEANAKCDLALECLDEDLPGLRSALDEAGVRYDVFVRSRAGGGAE
jgi:hypothetical protein